MCQSVIRVHIAPWRRGSRLAARSARSATRPGPSSSLIGRLERHSGLAGASLLLQQPTQSLIPLWRLKPSETGLWGERQFTEDGPPEVIEIDPQEHFSDG
jgi:hypothetical protein